MREDLTVSVVSDGVYVLLNCLVAALALEVGSRQILFVEVEEGPFHPLRDIDGARSDT